MAELKNPGKAARPGFGRLPAPDARDAGFPMRALAPPARKRPIRKLWRSTWIGDQGATSECVGFSWHGFLRSEPVVDMKPAPDAIYAGAQANDEFKGPPPVYAGSSVRGGAKFLTTQGKLTEYRWAKGIEDVLAWLAAKGPVVFGTDWYDGMMDTDPFGFVKPTGRIAGGHAYLIRGYDDVRGAIRIQNSWGLGWGQKGLCWLKYADAEKLLKAKGEACAAVETGV